MRRIWGVLVVACAMGVATQARADLVQDFSDGDHAARATFDIVGSQLTIKLENLAASSSVPMDLLTGVWFQLPDPSILSGGTVKLLGDAFIINPGTADLDDGDGVELIGGERYVSGEFGIETGADLALFPDLNVVIANAGLGDLVGVDDRFAGQDLDAPESPDGMNYGIAPLGGLAADANKPMGELPLIAGGVLITLDYSGSLSLSDIDNVMFNYGTDANPVPAPGAAILAVVGLGVVGLFRRRLG